jgi:hypothetical protein
MPHGNRQDPNLKYIFRPKRLKKIGINLIEIMKKWSARALQTYYKGHCYATNCVKQIVVNAVETHLAFGSCSIATAPYVLETLNNKNFFHPPP